MRRNCTITIGRACLQMRGFRYIPERYQEKDEKKKETPAESRTPCAGIHETCSNTPNPRSAQGSCSESLLMTMYSGSAGFPFLYIMNETLDTDKRR